MNGQTKFIIDNIVNNSKIKTILNIGYRHTSDPTIKNLCEKNNKIFSVLEVFPDNCKFMRLMNIDVIELNVIDIKTITRQFDAIIWLHGPEHIKWDEFLKCRLDIESKANKIVIYQAPIGNYPQEELYGNPYEKHVSSLTSNMFKELGYQTMDHDKDGEFTFSAWITK
jgi:hypothetical protein